MTKTAHPAKGCTKAQVALFDRIAAGDDTPASVAPKTLQALEAKGLIMRAGVKRFGGGWSAVSIPRWMTPIPVHHQWCQWCAENTEIPE